MSTATTGFASAARRTAPPSLADVAAEQRIIDGADPAQENPTSPSMPMTASATTMAAPSPATHLTPTGTLEPSDLLDRLAARKPKKVQLTPLHVNIPVNLDAALSRAIKDKGLEKTTIVIEALRPLLEGYL